LLVTGRLTPLTTALVRPVMVAPGVSSGEKVTVAWCRPGWPVALPVTLYDEPEGL